MSIKSFQSWAWREHQRIDPTYKTHGERKHFACEYYLALTRVLPPVKAGVAHGKAHHEYMASQLNILLQQARELDKEARMTISKSLGHHRVNITSAYLG